MVTLVVTSPHAKCPDSKERMCDLAAERAANVFCEIANQLGFTCYYFQGDEYRFHYDLNRSTSRNTKYRKDLKKTLEKLYNDKTDTIIIDIHSFPNYWIPEAGDINFFKKNETAPDAVMLIGRNDRYKNWSIGESFAKSLNNNGIKTKVLPGIEVNDILNQSAEYKIPGTLVEINEKYLMNQNGLQEIFRAILRVIYSLTSSN